MTRPWNRKLFLGIFHSGGGAAAGRSRPAVIFGVDEIFSLAMATGHSLEHSAAAARPGLGDFVEPDGAVPAGQFRRYLKHDNPPATPFRVIRAVSLSDTSPPFYYLLLYGWTLIVGTSDLALRSFSVVCSLACLPLVAAIARRTGGHGAVWPGSCILFSFSLALCLLLHGRSNVFSALASGAGDDLGFTAAARPREGAKARGLVGWIFGRLGFLTHYFFIFPWIALVALLAIRPGRFRRTRFAACILATGLLILPCISCPGEPGQVAGDS